MACASRGAEDNPPRSGLSQSVPLWYSFAPPMLKISKLTDYGLLAVVYLARKQGEVVSARDVAAFYHLPLPMVTKVLKALHQGQLIESRRGVSGGYTFAGDPETITLGRLLELLEGPWDLVECETTDESGSALCSIRRACPSRRFMYGINRAIKTAFDQVTLADLVRGTMPIPSMDKNMFMTAETM
jgi:FeS assembly SUF system regulator